VHYPAVIIPQTCQLRGFLGSHPLSLAERAAFHELLGARLAGGPMQGKRLVLPIALIINMLLGAAGNAQDRYGAAPQNIKESMDRLVRAYPDKIRGHDNDFLILRNGVKFQISDGRTDKTFEKLLEEPDIDDMFYSRYPLGTEPGQPAINVDPAAFVSNRFSSQCMATATRTKSPKICGRSPGFPNTQGAV
jgi:hypothetical protein